MRLTESCIWLRNLRYYACHGVLPQEGKVGGYFTVTLRLGYPLAAAMESDRLGDTLDYAAVCELVGREMRQPSALLEHVGGRIVKAIAAAFPQVSRIDLWLDKENPPMGADCQGTGIELHLINDKTG